MNCEHCGASIDVSGFNGPHSVGADTCFNCGRPYAHQPNPIESEMELRNMPAPGEKDMGGNPLQEGILADNGWKGRQNRDESFASVAALGDKGFTVDPETGEGSITPAPKDPSEQTDLDTYRSLMNQVRDFKSRGFSDEELERFLQRYENPEPNPWTGAPGSQTVSPAVLDAVRKSLFEGENVNLAELGGPTPDNISDVSVMDMVEQRHNQQQPHEEAPSPQGHQLEWQPGTAGRGALIGDSLHTWPIEKTPENPQGGAMHAEYLQSLGLDPNQHADSLFEIGPDGNVVTVGNAHPELPQRVQQIDPNLKTDAGAGDNWAFSRIQVPDDHLPYYMAAEEAPGPGGTVDPANAVESVGQPEFQVDEVIPPGGQTEEVTSPVLHNGNLTPMKLLGVKVDGKDLNDPAVYQDYATRSFANKTPDGRPGPQTITISHDDPQALAWARESAERGDGMHLLDEIKHYTQPKTTIQPNGIDDSLHQALGAFGTHVKDPATGQAVEYRRGHEQVRGGYQGGPLEISHPDPEVVNGIQEFATTGNKQPLLEYQQRQAKVAAMPGFGPFQQFIDPSDPDSTANQVAEDVGLRPEDLSVGELAESASWLVGGAALKGASKIPALLGKAKNLFTGAPKAGAGLNIIGPGSQAAGRGAKVLNKLKGAVKGGAGGARNMLAVQGLQNSIMGGPGGMGMVPPNPTYHSLPTLTHVHQADGGGWHPSSDPTMHNDDREVKDGDNAAAWEIGVNGIGGTDSPTGTGSNAPEDEAWLKHFPKILIYALDDSAVADDDDDPEFVDYINSLHEQAGEPQDDNIDDILDELEPVLDEAIKSLTHEANIAPSNPTTGLNPGHVPRPPQAPVAPQAPNPIPGENNCPRCGSPLSPEATSCPTCQSGVGVSQPAQVVAQFPPQQFAPANQTAMPSPEAQPAQPIPQADFSTANCAECGFSLPPGSAVCPHCNQQPGQAPPQQPEATQPPLLGPTGQTPGLIARAADISQEPIFAPPDIDSLYRRAQAGDQEAIAELERRVQEVRQQPGYDPFNEGGLPEEQFNQLLSKTASEHMGPHNNEQFAAVAELLTEEGRQDEIPGMLAEPWKYAEEMARVQSRATKPPIDDTLSDTPPEQAQDAAPPGATMPVPGMQVDQQMMAAIEKHATPDSYAPRCPECNSGSTGFASEEGDVYCHRCGNGFKKDIVKDFKSGFVYKSERLDHTDLHVNQTDEVDADQIQQDDVRSEHDTSLQWTDETGNPLHVGREYELHSANYDIPDIIKITAIKPDVIEYIGVGEWGLEHKVEVDKREASIERYSFVPTETQGDEIGAEEAELGTPEDQRQGVEPGETTDLSRPHQYTTHRQAAPPLPSAQEGLQDELAGQPSLDDGPTNSWQCENCGENVQRFRGEGDVQCPGCGQQYNSFGQRLAPPSQWGEETGESYGDIVGPDPESLGYPYEASVKQEEAPKTASAEWLTPTNPPQDQTSKAAWLQPGGGSDDDKPMETVRTAGAKYTPTEQREFINESGTARNRDKLNLAGTHYEDEIDDLFPFGL
jgi:uncharacterized Zn finger protein (UPF0148 family)